MEQNNLFELNKQEIPVKEIISNPAYADLATEMFASVIPKWDKKDRDIDFLLTGGTNRLRYPY